MKGLAYSNRLYYDELDNGVKEIIKHDIKIYNSMVHTSFKYLYDIAYKNVVLDKLLQKILKERVGTSDYMPLSATNETKALMHSISSTNS